MSKGKEASIRFHFNARQKKASMNPKHLSVRMDTETGNLWLTEEKFRKPIKKIADITAHVYGAFCAEFVMENGTKSVSRDIKFSDGSAIRITLEEVESADEQPHPSE